MSTVDLDAIRGKWLRVCGACDAGLSTGCVCPQEDPRPVMLGLVREVERLRARIAAHAGPHRRLIADRDEARAELVDLAERMDRRASERDAPADCIAMGEFADELRALATGEGGTRDG